VTLRAEATDGVVRIQVADTGPGVPPEHRETVFRKFTQLDPPPGASQQGTGLGLTICREIVEHYHGRIFLDSPPGHGAAFTVELPVVKGEG
jgi:signal transduction histidine kinase